MLGRKLKNSGMTLVEVLVSMLVLSIAAVTVISAFSMAAQVNTKAKKQQGTAALMEICWSTQKPGERIMPAGLEAITRI